MKNIKNKILIISLITTLVFGVLMFMDRGSANINFLILGGFSFSLAIFLPVLFNNVFIDGENK